MNYRVMVDDIPGNEAEISDDFSPTVNGTAFRGLSVTVCHCLAETRGVQGARVCLQCTGHRAVRGSCVNVRQERTGCGGPD